MASILPYSIDPIHGNYYILLGRESCIPVWEGSGLYSDYGGGVNPEDADEYDTAAREYHEETNRLIPLYEGEICPRSDWRGIAASLREGNYTMKIKFETEGWQYYTIIKQIPWMPDLTDHFSAAYLRAITSGAAEDQFTEKDNVQWVSPQRLLRIATSGRRHCRRRAAKSAKMYNEPIQLRPHFKKRIVHILRNFPATFAATMPPPSPEFSSAFSWRTAHDAVSNSKSIIIDGTRGKDQDGTSDACHDEETRARSTISKSCSDSTSECGDGHQDAHRHTSCQSLYDCLDIPPGFYASSKNAK